MIIMDLPSSSGSEGMSGSGLFNRDLPDRVKAYGVPVRQHGPADAFF